MTLREKNELEKKLEQHFFTQDVCNEKWRLAFEHFLKTGYS
jgi:hypothetical protein